MRAFLIVLLALCAKAGAVSCDLSGLIDYFPMNVTTTGVCQPGVYHLEPEGPIEIGACGLCGLGAVLPPVIVGSEQIRALHASPSLVSALQVTSFTIQLNIAAEWLNPELHGGYPYAGGFLDARAVGGLPYFQLFVKSTGEWYLTLFYSPTVLIKADVRLQAGRCYQITMARDGALHYLFLDGELVGGPITTPMPQLILESLRLGTGACCSDSKVQFSNLLFANTAIFPNAAPVPEVCVPAGSTPTATPEPTEMPTQEPTESIEPTVTATSSPSRTPSPTATPTNGIAAICSASDCPSPISSSFKQFQGSWKDVLLDSSPEAISRTGCLLTCFSMVNGIDPGKLNDQYKAITITAGQVFENGSGRIQVGRAVKLAGRFLDGPFPYSPVGLEKALCRGEIPLVRVWRLGQNQELGEHYVLVTGEDHSAPDGTTFTPWCRFRMEDPGSGRFDHLDSYERNGQEIADYRLLLP